MYWGNCVGSSKMKGFFCMAATYLRGYFKLYDCYEDSHSPGTALKPATMNHVSIAYGDVFIYFCQHCMWLHNCKVWSSPTVAFPFKSVLPKQPSCPGAAQGANPVENSWRHWTGSPPWTGSPLNAKKRGENMWIGQLCDTGDIWTAISWGYHEDSAGSPHMWPVIFSFYQAAAHLLYPCHLHTWHSQWRLHAQSIKIFYSNEASHKARTF